MSIDGRDDDDFPRLPAVSLPDGGPAAYDRRACEDALPSREARPTTPNRRAAEPDGRSKPVARLDGEPVARLDGEPVARLDGESVARLDGESVADVEAGETTEHAPTERRNEAFVR